MLIVQIQVNLGGTAHTLRCSSALWVQSHEPGLNRYTAVTVSPEAILAQEYSRTHRIEPLKAHCLYYNTHHTLNKACSSPQLATNAVLCIDKEHSCSPCYPK